MVKIKFPAGSDYGDIMEEINEHILGRIDNDNNIKREVTIENKTGFHGKVTK